MTFTTHKKPTIESRIADTLWHWKFATRADRDQIIDDSKLKSLIEFWFPVSAIEFTKKRGIWCDGVNVLEVKELSRTSFGLAGVGSFPIEYSAFEVEFHFRNRRDLNPQSTILRFGSLDQRGLLQLTKHRDHEKT